MSQPLRSPLDYFPTPPPRYRRKRTHHLLLLAAAGMVLLAGLLFYRTSFSSFSVSQDTAEILYEKTWSIPFTNFIVWTDRSISPSKLSAVIKLRGLKANYPHQWLYIEGHGNGAYAIGEGSEVWRSVDAKYVADFIDCAAACGNKQFAEKWLTLLLDPKTSSDACTAIGVSNLPPGGFSTVDQFNRWWKASNGLSTDMLGQPLPDLDGVRNQNHPSATGP